MTYSKLDISGQFGKIVSTGTRQPSEAFGTPILVSHYVVWPHEDNHPVGKMGERMEDTSNASIDYTMALSEYIGKVNKFARNLQELGASTEQYVQFEDEDAGEGIAAVKSDIITFTLWWLPSSQDAIAKNRSDIPPEAMPVRVHIEWFQDFISISFFLDVNRKFVKDVSINETEHWAQRYCTKDEVSSSTQEAPLSRRKVLHTAQDINQICEPIFEDLEKLTNEEREETTATQETHTQLLQKISNDEKNTLNEASNLLYDDIWKAFRKDFGLSHEREEEDSGTNNFPGELGEIYAHFHNVALSVAPNCEDLKGWEAAPGFARRTSKMERVVRAYWPFIRTVTKQPEVNDHVVFGILESREEKKARGIYASALGAPGHIDGEEQENISPETREAIHIEPIKSLILFSGEPQETPWLALQLGRMFLRLNRMGSMRMAALRDLGAMRRGDIQLRMSGMQLDNVISEWLEAQQERNKDQQKRSQEEQIASFKQTERLLLEQSRRLNNIGKGIQGGFSYRVARTRRYIDQFYMLEESIRQVPVEGWVSYKDFIRRRLRADFDDLINLGKRQRRLRERHDTAMSMVQTSISLTQSEQQAIGIQATNENTDKLVTLQDATRSNTRQLVDLQESTEDNTDKLVRIQRTARLFGTFAVIATCTAAGGQISDPVFKTAREDGLLKTCSLKKDSPFAPLALFQKSHFFQSPASTTPKLSQLPWATQPPTGNPSEQKVFPNPPQKTNDGILVKDICFSHSSFNLLGYMAGLGLGLIFAAGYLFFSILEDLRSSSKKKAERKTKEVTTKMKDEEY